MGILIIFSSMLRVGIDTHLIVVSDPGRDERNKRESKKKDERLDNGGQKKMRRR